MIKFTLPISACRSIASFSSGQYPNTTSRVYSVTVVSSVKSSNKLSKTTPMESSTLSQTDKRTHRRPSSAALFGMALKAESTVELSGKLAENNISDNNKSPTKTKTNKSLAAQLHLLTPPNWPFLLNFNLDISTEDISSTQPIQIKFIDDRTLGKRVHCYYFCYC